MKPSIQTHRRSRLAIFGFLALAVLLIGNPNPLAFQKDAQAGWRVEIEEGKTASSTLAINNRCKAPHEFSVENPIKYLRFEQPTRAIVIGAAGTAQLGVVFDAKGLKPGVHRGKLTVKCLNCKKEKGCTQDRDEVPVEVTVTNRLVQGQGIVQPGSQLKTKSTQRSELTSLKSTSDSVAAAYQSDFATLKMEVKVAGDQIRSTLRDDTRHLITRLEIPNIGREMTPGEAQAVIEASFKKSTPNPDFRRLDMQQAVGLIWSSVQFADKLSERLPSNTPAGLRTAVRLQPAVLAMNYEKSPPPGKDKRDRYPSLMKLYRQDSGCGGACGPGCGWCACSGGLCLGYTNDFCEWHDAHCGAWWNFFNCDASIWSFLF